MKIVNQVLLIFMLQFQRSNRVRIRDSTVLLSSFYPQCLQCFNAVDLGGRKDIWPVKNWVVGCGLRHDGFLLGIFEGRMLGKRTRGRKRTQMLHDLTVNSDYITLKQTAAERMMWRYSGGISRTCSAAEDWRKERMWAWLYVWSRFAYGPANATDTHYLLLQ